MANCANIRAQSHGYLHGELPEDEAAAIGAHAQQCPSCEQELRNSQSVLGLLHTLPDIHPSPDVWTKIEENLTVPAGDLPAAASAKSGARLREGSGGQSLRFWLRSAAAASILVAVLSFVYVMTRPAIPAATVAFVAPDSDIQPGQTIELGKSFKAPSYMVLTLPDIGTLRVAKDTILRFDERRRLTLESGEVFAEITPGGKGFRIESGDTTATVKGTRFGVKSGTTVYVVEGSVEVATPRGRIELAASQVATSGKGKLPDSSVEDYIRWLSRCERPAVSLEIRAQDRIVDLRRAFDWELVLGTNSLAPLYFSTTLKLSLLIQDPDGNESTLPLDASMITRVQAPSSSNGLWRLDVTHPARISCRIDPRVFSARGTHKIKAALLSGEADPNSSIWVGLVQSDPLTIEVK